MDELPLEHLRSRLCQFINARFSQALPLEWENMPTNVHQPEQGWVRAEVVVDRLDRIGFSPGLMLQRGRVRLSIAVATGLGMTLLDQVVAEFHAMLAGQLVEGIRLASPRMAAPEIIQGYRMIQMEIPIVARASLGDAS